MREEIIYFNIGEFARLAHTTKDTLLHYDYKDILKPAKIGDNGYRYYTPLQFFDLDLIRVLKEAGSSLDEIKTYLQNRCPENYIDLLKDKKEQLQQLRIKIEHMERLLQNSIESTLNGMQQMYDVPFIETQDEEFFAVVPVNKKVTDEDISRIISDFLEDCEENLICDDIPVGSIILYDDLLDKNFCESFYCIKIQNNASVSNVHIKPKGKYAVIYHKGSYQSMPNGVEKLLNYIYQNNFEVIGDCYEYDVIGYIAAPNNDEMVLKLSIRIK